MEPVERLCDRLLMLHRGSTVLYATPQEARERFAEGIVRVEHSEASISELLPDGTVVKNAVPHITHLIPPPGMTPRDVIATLLGAGVDLRGFETVMLVTATPEGRIEGRPMQIVDIDPRTGNVSFFTGRESRKVHEITDNAQVAIVCQNDRSAYLSLAGVGVIVHEPSRVREPADIVPGG
jgi:hypothetical protein